VVGGEMTDTVMAMAVMYSTLHNTNGALTADETDETKTK